MSPRLITAGDREAGLIMSFALVVACCDGRLARTMLGELVKVRGCPRDPVEVFARGGTLFAQVEFVGMAPLPVALRLDTHHDADRGGEG